MSQRFFCNRQIEESNRAISQWNNTLYHKRLLRFSDQGYIVRQNVYGSGHSLGHLNRALEPYGASCVGHGLPCVGCDAYRLCAAPQHGSGHDARHVADVARPHNEGPGIITGQWG